MRVDAAHHPQTLQKQVAWGGAELDSELPEGGCSAQTQLVGLPEPLLTNVRIQKWGPPCLDFWGFL